MFNHFDSVNLNTLFLNLSGEDGNIDTNEWMTYWIKEYMKFNSDNKYPAFAQKQEDFFKDAYGRWNFDNNKGISSCEFY